MNTFLSLDVDGPTVLGVVIELPLHRSFTY